MWLFAVKFSFLFVFHGQSLFSFFIAEGRRDWYTYRQSSFSYFFSCVCYGIVISRAYKLTVCETLRGFLRRLLRLVLTFWFLISDFWFPDWRVIRVFRGQFLLSFSSFLSFNRVSRNRRGYEMLIDLRKNGFLSSLVPRHFSLPLYFLPYFLCFWAFLRLKIKAELSVCWPLFAQTIFGPLNIDW